jgi:cobalt-zinc-cadmium efflux system membrane fusion protein
VTGETLAIVDSSDLGTAKAEYLQAQALMHLTRKNDARQKRLMESNVATERDILEAETRLAESHIALSRASQRLRNLGFSDDQLETISEKRDTSSLLPLRSPFKGIVVERSAVLGEVVDSKAPLFAIADTARMWVMLDIYESDIPRVLTGQPVVFEAEGLPGEQRGGSITWISSHVEKRTRTLKVRSEIANPGGLLRSGMFGKGIISVRKDESALLVPKGSVQWEGCCNIVFVKHSDVLFEPRKVKLGYEMDRFFVVEDGLEEGEEIVTVGSFLLKTEILKGSIGAGCCEIDLGKE